MRNSLPVLQLLGLRHVITHVLPANSHGFYDTIKRPLLICQKNLHCDSINLPPDRSCS